jgi:hypothetical protein
VKTSERPSKLHQHLHLYALAASAAGVSMLALAQPGEAEIVYTPADADLGGLHLDLTGDGTIDFEFQIRSTSIGSGAGIFRSILRVHPEAGNGVYSPPLRAGASIGPNVGFSSGGYWFSLANGTRFYSNWPKKRRFSCGGSWKDQSGRFLGLRFMINGETHYGWARITTTCRRGRIDGTLTGYAYETVPNQGLEAGKKKGEFDESVNGLRKLPNRG